MMVALLWAAILPGRLKAQGNLPCPPVDVNRPDVFTNATSTIGSFTFQSLADFQNGLNGLINLYINAKGGKTYQVRYRFLNGVIPLLSSSGQTINPTNALQASASFGTSGWGVLNVQMPISNVTLATGWSTLATFKARCAVTRGNLIVNLKALGTTAGVNAFFVKGTTPALDYGKITVEFQLFQVDNGTQQDLRNVEIGVQVNDIMTFTINASTTTIDATPRDYITGIEVTATNQLTVTSNNPFDISISSAANNLAADGNGAVGNVDFSDISMRVPATVLNMGTLSTRNITTTPQVIASGATGAMNKPVSLTYRLQNTSPKNLHPGTYAGTVYITVTEN